MLSILTTWSTEKNNQKMKNSSEKLDFIKPLLLLIIFIIILAILFTVFSFLSNQRKEKIYAAYEVETQQYINQNRPQLLKLFNELFPEKLCPFHPETTTPCQRVTPEEIAALLPSTLRDWSSTAFIKKGVNKTFYMRLSGEVGEHYTSQKYADALNSLLSGQQDKIPWEDYSYLFVGKEVVFPVKDDSGRVVGAIMRGVIEDQSF